MNGSTAPTEPKTSIRRTRGTSSDCSRAVTGRHAARDRCSARGVPRVVPLVDPGTPRHPQAHRRRDPGAQGGARPAARARGRQDAGRRHRRGRARGPDLQVLRRPKACASPARSCLRSGRASTSRSRASRSACRHHHAVEFPDRDPRLEDRARARLRQLRRVQARRPGARLLRRRSAEIIARAGLPAGRVQSRHGPRHRGRRALSQHRRTSTRSASPVRSRPGRRSPPPRSRA